MTKRGSLVAAGVLVTALLAAGAWFTPLPYVVWQPGPAIDVLGDDVITVAGAATYPSTGRLLLTTVAVDGDTDLAGALRAWFDEDEALVPRAASYPGDQARRANQALFQQSSAAAVAGALTRLGKSGGAQVRINLDGIGGSSAGLMILLGIVDTLTPADLTGGTTIAGTGELDPGGAVGPIGGIAQKLHGAGRAGARWFLVPAGNCDEAAGITVPGLTTVRVATVDDALDALDVIAAGGTPPPC
ncbi:S16 family serine protease [Actinoplanes rectilineatus]|uniref:S16 family serine protease n=1 Tax=Actinoplanes rectilineatus TaxID=113571 RepID=UPI0005F2F53A|nr:S16 family serine protease [Actinoplanes rectilineatus]